MSGSVGIPKSGLARNPLKGKDGGSNKKSAQLIVFWSFSAVNNFLFANTTLFLLAHVV